MPGAGFLGDIHSSAASPQRPGDRAGGYGTRLKNDYRRFYGATVNFSGRGEMMPNEHSYCEIDPTVVDRWGIPVLRFHFKWTDYECNQAGTCRRPSAALIEADGRHAARRRCPARRPATASRPAAASSTRSASRAWATRQRRRSLNGHCQAHDVKNLFVADGGPFVTNADKNVTWTILALAMRTSEYIAEQRKAGAI